MLAKVIYSIIVFASLILFHELGHFILAKLVGVHVYEFSMGFGPRLLGFRIGETSYNLRLVPLGGFVRMAGMDPEEDERESQKILEEGSRPEISEQENDKPIITPERSFMNKSVPKRMGIIAAGPIMNFVLAILLFAVGFFALGLPVNKNVIGGVLEGKPAAQAGLKAGDVVKSIDNKPVKTWEDIVNIIHKNPEKQITMEISRNGESKTIVLSPIKDKESKQGMIGISYPTRRPGIIESVKLGVTKTYEMLKLTIYFLGKMLAKQMPVELSGPVRITYELGKAAEMGILTMINFASFLSIQIGLFNLLPIPALDGSRLLFLGIEGLRGTPIDSSKENLIHLVGLVLMLLLMVVVTYQDIVKLVS